MSEYQGCQEALDLGTRDRELGHQGPHELVDQFLRMYAGEEYVLITWPIDRDSAEVRRYYARAAADDPEEAEAQAEDALAAQQEASAT